MEQTLLSVKDLTVQFNTSAGVVSAVDCINFDIKEKEIWNYDNLDFKAWIVACYGWNEELLDEARSRGIIPITLEKLEKELRKHEIFDRRIPICPTNESVSK